MANLDLFFKKYFLECQNVTSNDLQYEKIFERLEKLNDRKIII